MSAESVLIRRRETVVEGPVDGRVCSNCGGVILESTKHYRVGVEANESNFHPNCFVCSICGNALDRDSFRERGGVLYCPNDFGEAFW
jgi:hypothetical protein